INDKTMLSTFKKTSPHSQQTIDGIILTHTNNGVIVQMKRMANTQQVTQVMDHIIHCATKPKTKPTPKTKPKASSTTFKTVAPMPEETVVTVNQEPAQQQLVATPPPKLKKPLKKSCAASKTPPNRSSAKLLVAVPVLPRSPFALPVFTNALFRFLNGARNIFICFSPTYDFIKPKKLDSTIEERFIKLLDAPQKALSVNDNGFKWIASEGNPVLVGKLTTLPFRLFPSHKEINASGEMAFFYNEIRHTKSGKKSECYKAKLLTKQ
ncbi:MAG TPA: hypothetical protein PLD88_09910, partial [Candidatus Berkiella sp.]|nr:hypothetical protein [Candidatus Berkiella sp.]